MLGSSCKYFLQAFEQVKTTKTKVWRRKIWEKYQNIEVCAPLECSHDYMVISVKKRLYGDFNSWDQVCFKSVIYECLLYFLYIESSNLA